MGRIPSSKSRKGPSDEPCCIPLAYEASTVLPSFYRFISSFSLSFLPAFFLLLELTTTMLMLNASQARRLAVAKAAPSRALSSASTTCCSLRGARSLPLLRVGGKTPSLPSLAARTKRIASEEEEEEHLLCRATPEDQTEEAETAATTAEEPSESRKLLKNAFYVASAIALPIVAWSEVVTITTGEGLQGLLLGGLEGISYLVLLGLVGKSIALKVRTGSGLPAGPYGLIGAMEGIAYLEVVGFIASQVFHK